MSADMAKNHPARVKSIPRFAMRRDEAAASLGVSAAKFDQWVKDERMPKGYRIDGLVLWDVEEVRAAWIDMRDSVPSRGNPLDTIVL